MTQNPGDEAKLLSQALAGDADALGELLVQVGPTVRKRLTGRIGTHWQSVLSDDDVMQVTYLEAFLRIGQCAAREINGFVAWLSRIAENNLTDAVRELERAKRPDPRNRVRRSSHEESCTTLLATLADSDAHPTRQVRLGEAVEMLEAAITKLPPEYATVVRRCDLQGDSAKDVAATLGRSEGAVYMLRSRALQRLQELMGTTFSQILDSGT